MNFEIPDSGNNNETTPRKREVTPKPGEKQLTDNTLTMENFSFRSTENNFTGAKLLEEPSSLANRKSSILRIKTDRRSTTNKKVEFIDGFIPE